MDESQVVSFPTGPLVDFKPSPLEGKKTLMFESEAIPGVFVGYHILPQAPMERIDLGSTTNGRPQP